MATQPIIAFELVFHGLVQGVGFRYTSYEIARDHPGIAGWVRNLWNGTVEMHVQGTRENIEAYLGEITQTSRLARLIEKVNRKTGTVISNQQGFRIER